MHISTIFLDICRVIKICHVIEISVLLSVGTQLKEGFEDRDSAFTNFEMKLDVSKFYTLPI